MYRITRVQGIAHPSLILFARSCWHLSILLLIIRILWWVQLMLNNE